MRNRNSIVNWIGLGMALAIAVPAIYFTVRFIDALSASELLAMGVAIFVLVIVIVVMFASVLSQAFGLRVALRGLGTNRMTVHQHHGADRPPRSSLPLLPPAPSQLPGAQQPGAWLDRWPQSREVGTDAQIGGESVVLE
jgi:hypothetical protein